MPPVGKNKKTNTVGEQTGIITTREEKPLNENHFTLSCWVDLEQLGGGNI